MIRALIALALLLLLPAARAQTPVTLSESFAGNVNFVGTQKTIRTSSNAGNACDVMGQNKNVFTTLSGIPAGATIERAHLYWAGSGTADYTVEMNGYTIASDNSRKRTASPGGRAYYGGAADVTSLVAAQRNGTYSFRELQIKRQDSYCPVEGVVGGFALLVVYSDPSEPFRVLNLYEGFQPTHYSSVDLSLSNFMIPSPLGTATARVGHITWEGDETLGNTNEENLFFNGYEMTDATNLQYNQFNSKSTINNDGASYGIDFDSYTVGAPIIQPGQTTATTRYQSGQDLVLLHVEVIAVPNVAVADVSIGMTVANSVMTQGVSNSYGITVRNNGPMAEPGPIVVSDTIPSQLAITSVTGTGWTCSVSGQQVSCSRAGPVPANTTLDTITITVTPVGSPGTMVNSASVAGQTFDNHPENNTATVSTGAAAAEYVLTDKACVHGLALTHPSQPCRVYSFGNRVAGTPITSIFITALDASGVPARLHNTQDRVVYFYFGLSCINPGTTAGVVPSFTGRASMTTCAPGTKPVGTRDSAVTFDGGTPSSEVGYALTYNDVGMIEFYFEDTAGDGGSSGAFVSMPAQIKLTSVSRNSPTAAVNPGATTPAGPAFVQAGEAFSMSIASLAANGLTTPNFGRESPPETFKVTTGPATDPVTGSPFAEMANVPSIQGSWGNINAGSSSGNGFTWNEVGILRLIPGTFSGSYLGQTPVNGTATNVGRFYPHHFDTEVVEPMPNLCPSGTGCPFGAAYSDQPFTVRVLARNAGNNVVQNYRGRFARDVGLAAWTEPGGGVIDQPSGSSLLNAAVPAGEFEAGIATVEKPTYRLPARFSSDVPRSAPTAPAAIYLRAIEGAGDGVTSDRDAASEEGPIWIVSGRLMVSHVYGSELLNLPVPLKAQYWTGSRWVNSTTDNVSVVTLVDPVLGSRLEVSDCTLGMASNCSLAPVSSAPFTLVGGVGTLRLQAPGVSRAGGARVKLTSPDWLPGTVGQLVFGRRRAPLDYIREVY